ncbi:MAG: hypothetical protein AB1730_01740 [Myxococcota bacterium]
MSAAEGVVVAAEPAGPVPDKRPQVEALLSDIFRLMEYPVRLDFKDLADGSLGVAVHVEGEQPGITPGKKSFLVDSVQFLVNKAVNRPNTPRRWVNLGINGFPEPRLEKPAPAPQASAPPAPKASTPAAGAKAQATKGGEKGERRDEAREQTDPKKHHAPRDADEASAKVEPDAEWTRLAKALAEKSAKLGRPFGVMLLTPEDRARVVQAAAGTPGVTVKAEGEGIWRRVAFKPDKLTPMPKKAVMPDYDEEDE